MRPGKLRQGLVDDRARQTCLDIKESIEYRSEQASILIQARTGHRRLNKSLFTKSSKESA
jgi:hypothetical protein